MAYSSYLEVQPNTIETYGVVSEAVALEMAKGAAHQAQAEVGLSTRSSTSNCYQNWFHNITSISTILS